MKQYVMRVIELTVVLPTELQKFFSFKSVSDQELLF